MSIAILLITHENVAKNLLAVTSSIIDSNLDNTDYLEVLMDTPVEQVEFRIDEKLAHLDQNSGLLILTDIYGGTPSNIAATFAKNKKTKFISGVNLPMLVRIMNYRTLPLNELASKAIEGGHDGIAVYEQGLI